MTDRLADNPEYMAASACADRIEAAVGEETYFIEGWALILYIASFLLSAAEGDVTEAGVGLAKMTAAIKQTIDEMAVAEAQLATLN